MRAGAIYFRGAGGVDEEVEGAGHFLGPVGRREWHVMVLRDDCLLQVTGCTKLTLTSIPILQ